MTIANFASANEVRRVFRAYFRQAAHEIVPSAALMPRNDPTLIFVNSGMVRLEHVFTGQKNAVLPPERALDLHTVRAGFLDRGQDLFLGFLVLGHQGLDLVGLIGGDVVMIGQVASGRRQLRARAKLRVGAFELGGETVHQPGQR